MKVVAIVGAGFFTDASVKRLACITTWSHTSFDRYDTFVIDTVATILGFVYGQSDNTDTPRGLYWAFFLARSCADHSPLPYSSHPTSYPWPESSGAGRYIFRNDIFCLRWRSLGTQAGMYVLILAFSRGVVGLCARIDGMELFIIITAVFVQAMLGQGGAVNIINSMIIWRLIVRNFSPAHGQFRYDLSSLQMGVGIGGDYPTSAVIASEFAPIAFRGRMVTAVFATQGLGQFGAHSLHRASVLADMMLLVGIIVSIILVYAYKPILDSAANSDPDAVEKALDQMWRILIGIGCVPGTLALFYRFTIPETPRFTMDIARNVNQASQDIDTFLTTGGFFVNPDARVEHVLAPIRSWDDWIQTYKIQRNFVTLVGTCFSWFALDVSPWFVRDYN